MLQSWWIYLQHICQFGKGEALTYFTTASQAAQPPQFLATDVQNLPCFNPREDPNNLLVRWKRSFELNLLAKGVSSDRQKVELLFMLHTAGAELQDFKKLYYTLVGIEKLNRGPTCML